MIPEVMRKLLFNLHLYLALFTGIFVVIVGVLILAGAVNTSMIGANGLAILERGTTRAESGSVVPAVLIGSVAGE